MERAKKGEGLDRWLRMDRKKRREEAARLATLAKLGERVVEIVKEQPAKWWPEDAFCEIEEAVRKLGLLPEVESK